ncbi:polyribonucleotide nucleotidyltransferase [Moorella thermoacetica Y72]|uniref:Polyribonucleotide nucleotidyltransferase n=1 Tax=Moorella thermoacetica Y72 TaxID=1325331 RepID=A0A0S6UF79_NEOTH|nr:polyribonucleotide nucleotidyltransferase [Moorella thermoacetica Y72]
METHHNHLLFDGFNPDQVGQFLDLPPGYRRIRANYLPVEFLQSHGPGRFPLGLRPANEALDKGYP